MLLGLGLMIWGSCAVVIAIFLGKSIKMANARAAAMPPVPVRMYVDPGHVAEQIALMELQFTGGEQL